MWWVEAIATEDLFQEKMEDGKGGVIGQKKPPRSEAGDRPYSSAIPDW